MRFQPVKRNITQITRKRTNKIQVSYTLKAKVLENVDCIKYLGVTITNDFNIRWNNILTSTKANRTLSFLRLNIYRCPQDVKEAAYKGLFRPVSEYGSCVWDSQGVVL